MNRKDDFKIVLREWKDRELPEIIERDIQIPLKLNQIAALAGPRRAGKTYQIYDLIKILMKKGLTKDNILYINFEHERLKNLNAKDLKDMLEVFYEFFNPKGKIYLFLDEIQNIDDWDLWLRKIQESKEFYLYISGSSSKLLSKEITTKLSGRSIDFIIFPFSFKEFLNAKGFKIKDIESFRYSEKFGRLLGLLEEYILYGKYPEVVLEERKEIKIKILQSYYNTIFYKDLVERFKIDNLSLLDVFLKYNLKNISKYLSISKTYNYLKSAGYKCSKQTLLNYLKYATEVFFLFPVEIFSYSLKNKGQYPKKVYVIDNGIVNAIYPEIKIETGKLMEHLVATELVRESELFNKFEIYYWKEYGRQDGREIDFVIKEGLKVKQLIQVTYASARDEIEKRELRALVKASELLKCKNLLVITWDYEAEEEFKGRKIKFMPLWWWLLKDFFKIYPHEQKIYKKVYP